MTLPGENQHYIFGQVSTQHNYKNIIIFPDKHLPCNNLPLSLSPLCQKYVKNLVKNCRLMANLNSPLGSLRWRDFPDKPE